MTDPHALLALRNALGNAFVEPFDDACILAILRGDAGTPAQRRTLFSDVSLAGLLRAGRAHGIDRATILAAYAAARAVLAANPELDAALAEAAAPFQA